MLEQSESTVMEEKIEQSRVLIVDDEELNRKVLKEILSDYPYDIVEAENAFEASDILETDNEFDVILLDRMMPGMDGIELLAQINEHPVLQNIPIIMQTAAASSEQVLEGIEAGVFYYLTKPFQEDVLIGIVQSALRDASFKRRLKEEVRKQIKSVGLMQTGSFYFKTLLDAKNVSFLLANGFPDPEKVVLGLSELLINAVEHGNLGITYEEKKELLNAGKWQQEIEKRLELLEYQDKFAKVSFDRLEDRIEIVVEDQGQGFDWQQYVDTIPTERISDPNGRGIITARMCSFDSLDYQDCGNKVIGTIKL